MVDHTTSGISASFVTSQRATHPCCVAFLKCESNHDGRRDSLTGNTLHVSENMRKRNFASEYFNTLAVNI